MRLPERSRAPPSGSEGCRFGALKLVERGPRGGGRRRRDERLLLALRQPERIGVPGVELAQVAAGALDAQMVLGLVDNPAQLVRDLGARRRAVAQAEQPLEPP